MVVDEDDSNSHFFNRRCNARHDPSSGRRRQRQRNRQFGSGLARSELQRAAHLRHPFLQRERPFVHRIQGRQIEGSAEREPAPVVGDRHAAARSPAALSTTAIDEASACRAAFSTPSWTMRYIPSVSGSGHESVVSISAQPDRHFPLPLDPAAQLLEPFVERGDRRIARLLAERPQPPDERAHLELAVLELILDLLESLRARLGIPVEEPSRRDQLQRAARSGLQETIVNVPRQAQPLFKGRALAEAPEQIQAVEPETARRATTSPKMRSSIVMCRLSSANRRPRISSPSRLQDWTRSMLKRACSAA